MTYLVSIRRTILCLAMSSLLLPAGAAVAQDDALEEITVTAQRREQSIKDVPIAITAIGEDAVRDLNLQKPQDLADAVPGLNIGGRAEGQIPTFTIRGLGFGGALGSQAVSVNIDEVAFSNGLFTQGQLYDTARVEVLKGPQGDLYGRNTTGGAVNFVTNKPSPEKEVKLQVGFGNLETFETEGVLNGAISDNVNARLSWQSYNRGEGWQTNWQTGEKLGESNRYGARLQLGFEPSEELSILFNIHTFNDDSDPRGTNAVSWNPRYGTAPAGVISPNQDDPTLVNWEDTPFTNCNTQGTGCREFQGKPKLDHESFGGSIRLEWDFGDHYTLTSLTAFETLDRSIIRDFDGSVIGDADELAINEFDMFTQELRIGAAPTDRFNWLAGLFYGRDEIKEQQIADALDFFAIDGTPPFLFTTNWRQKTDSLGIFAHAEYSFTDKLTLVGGLRWSSEEKKIFDAGSYNIGDMQGDPFVQFVYGSGLIFPTCTYAGWADGGLLTDNIAGVCNTASDLERVQKDEDPSGKLILVYQPNADHTTYFSMSRGQKSGGFNGANLVVSPSLGPYDQETVNAFELGWKASFADSMVSMNSAIFHYDYKDRQTGGTPWDPIFTTAAAIVNVDETEVQGGELELTVRPTDALELYFGAAYVRSKVVKFIAYDVDTAEDTGRICDGMGQNPDENNPGGFWCFITRDASGDRLAIRPWQYNARISYDWNVGGNSLRAALTYNKRDDQPDFEGDGDFNPGYDTIGASIRLNDAEGRWGLELWGANLADDIPRNPGGTINVVVARTPFMMTRTFGIRGTMYWQ